jgi:hypothetical protein
MRDVSYRRIGTLVVALTALVALVASAAFGAKLTTKSETAVLPADSDTHTVTAKCPKGSKATGGGTQLSDDVFDYVQGSYPSGKRGWTAAGYRTVGPTDAEFTAFARCLKGAKMSTESESASIPDDSQAHSATAKCPKGTKVSGGGMQLSDDVLTETGGSYPSGKREWTAVGEAAGGPGEIIATARCLKSAKLVRKSSSLDMPDDDATHTVTAKCPKGSKATGGGIELSEPYDDYVQGTYPTGKREWTAAGFDEGVVTAHVICLKKPKKK